MRLSSVSHRSIVGAVALTLITACRADAPTNPIGRPAVPADPKPILTGAVGTPIFTLVPPGDQQPAGDARGLNALGQVTGAEFGLLPIDDTYKPYRWTLQSGAVKLVGCCDTQWGNDINDAGTVVGVAQTSRTIGNRGFVAAATSMTALPILPGGDPEGPSGAMAINNAGQIVGISPVSGGGIHAVLWSSSLVPQDLGTLGGLLSAAIDINDAGQVIGSSFLPGDVTLHYFLWSAAGGMVDLNTVISPALNSVVEINTSGQIIGSYFSTSGLHAFLYTPGSGLRDLGTLGGLESTPTGLNDKGDVVGSSTLADGSTHAFLWTASEGMEDITAITGVPEVRRLNDNLQTLTGTDAPATFPNITRTFPQLVQLQVIHANTPPTASFTVSCVGLTCTFDASASTDDAPGLTFAWDLNKVPGGSAAGAIVTTTYPHLGTRTVTLTVTDAGGLTSTLSKAIDLSALPVAAFTVSCTGLTCTFDATGATDDGGIVSYNWNLDKVPGGSATGVTVTTSYPHTGPRNVTLTVTDANGQSSSITKLVNLGATTDAPPVAAFSWSCTGLTCTFNASGSTDDVGITSYSWNLDKFPNGSASGVQVTTTYPHTGARNVTLTVTDTKGQTGSVTHTIDVD